MTTRSTTAKRGQAERQEAIDSLRDIFTTCARYTRHDSRCDICHGWVTRDANGATWTHDDNNATTQACTRRYSPVPTFTHKPKVYCNITHVSASGMQRRIKFFVVLDNELQSITYDISRVYGASLNDQGVKVNGCGMDMRFHVLDSVAGVLGMPGITSGNDFDIRGL